MSPARPASAALARHELAAAIPETTSAPPPAEVPIVAFTCVLDPGIGEAVETFARRAQTDDGRVTVLSLETVAAHKDGRWPLRRSQVHKYVEALLRLELGAEASFLRVTETDYVVSQPALDRTAGHVACLRALRKVLLHFMGSSARAPAGILEVRSISKGQIEGHTLDAEQLIAAEAQENVERERTAALVRAIEPFVAAGGRPIRVACQLEPVLKLSPMGEIGLRLGRRVVDEADGTELSAHDIAGLAGADIMRVDWASVIQGLAQLRERDRGPCPPTLTIPISYTSLSSHRGRAEMVTLLKDARECAGHGVIGEISGLEGAPRAALEEAVSIIEPLCLFLVAKVTGPAAVGLGMLRGMGFRCLAVDCPEFTAGAELMGWASSIAARARPLARTVLVYGVASERHARALRGAGITHATVQSR